MVKGVKLFSQVFPMNLTSSYKITSIVSALIVLLHNDREAIALIKRVLLKIPFSRVSANKIFGHHIKL